MIERIVPVGVIVVETRGEAQTALSRDERGSIRGAVARRRHEFAAGRLCARRAIERLGSPPALIGRGPAGEPLWPAGIVGSMTHCRGYRACAVARASDVAAIGIDAEPHGPLPPGVVRYVASARELSRASRRLREAWPDRLLFSAKEAAAKAWSGLTGRWASFEDMEAFVDATGFRVALRPPDGSARAWLAGRWCARDGVLATAVVVEAAP